MLAPKVQDLIRRDVKGMTDEQIRHSVAKDAEYLRAPVNKMAADEASIRHGMMTTELARRAAVARGDTGEAEELAAQLKAY